MADEKTYTQEQVDAALDKETKGLKAKHEELMDELKDLKRTHKQFEGLDPEEIKETLRAAKEAENKRLEAEGDWKKLRDQMREDHAKEIQKRDAQIDSLTKGMDETRTQVAIDSAMKEAKIAPQFADTVEAFLKTKIVLTGKGEARTAVIGDKSPGDFLKEYVGTDNGKHYVLADSNSGGGSPGGRKGSGSPDNPFDPEKPNITKQMEVMKTDPQRAKTLQQQAGVAAE
jgi:hypothetical protein